MRSPLLPSCRISSVLPPPISKKKQADRSDGSSPPREGIPTFFFSGNHTNRMRQRPGQPLEDCAGILCNPEDARCNRPDLSDPLFAQDRIILSEHGLSPFAGRRRNPARFSGPLPHPWSVPLHAEPSQFPSRIRTKDEEAEGIGAQIEYSRWGHYGFSQSGEKTGRVTVQAVLSVLWQREPRENQSSC